MFQPTLKYQDPEDIRSCVFNIKFILKNCIHNEIDDIRFIEKIVNSMKITLLFNILISSHNYIATVLPSCCQATIIKV